MKKGDAVLVTEHHRPQHPCASGVRVLDPEEVAAAIERVNLAAERPATFVPAVEMRAAEDRLWACGYGPPRE